MLLDADERFQEEFAAEAGRGTRLMERREDVAREQLHVVVQHGRLFQQHHPDVHVIHDRGRFLLVKLDPERAGTLARTNETCYGVMPLKESGVVFDVREPVASRAPVAFVQNLVDKVTRATFETSLTKLVSFSTRHSTSTDFAGAATWARNQLKEMGYKMRSQTVKVNGSNSRNVIADRSGTGADARQVVMVTAHLDSINAQGGAAAPAPGADDNGSGSAGLLEIARAFQDHRGVHDLRLILFGGEEQGLFGSKRYIASLPSSERTRIRAVVNMDMIGSLNSSSRSVLLEGAPLSQRVIDGLSQAAADYTELIVETSLNPFNSDHVPFINAGVPAVLTIEGADNTNNNVHSSADTIETIDYELALDILRTNVAFVASEVGRAS
jgi:Zn-dependent M28 family amino/carboxypeptidase